MRLTWWGHSCVTLDHPGGRLVVDPGAWSDTDGALAGATAVVVTHEHVDHLAVEPVLSALAGSTGLTVLGPEPVVRVLSAAGADPTRLRTVHGGDVVTAAGLEVRAVGEVHATIHPDLPPIANVGYLVGGVYHPGDSVAVPGGAGQESAVEVLLVPIGGPWLRAADAIDLVRLVAPRLAVPIHDGPLSDVGRALVDRLVTTLGGVPYRRLSSGESLDLPVAAEPA